MEIEYAVLSEKGPVREENQDYFLVSDFSKRLAPAKGGAGALKLGPRGALLAVADGMGGGPAGREAAEIALSTLLAGMSGASAGPSPDAALKSAIEAANSAVFGRGQADRALKGMGTTLTAAVAAGRHLIIGHVGDTRAYLLRRGRLTRLTSDHTFLEKVAGMSADKAQGHAQRGVLAQCVGGEYEDVSVELSSVEVCAGDTLLFCSDGLYSVVGDDEIQGLLAAESAEAASRSLVARALDSRSKDNVTVVVARFAGRDLAAPDAQREPRLRRLHEIAFNSEAGRLEARPGSEAPVAPSEEAEGPKITISTIAAAAALLLALGLAFLIGRPSGKPARPPSDPGVPHGARTQVAPKPSMAGPDEKPSQGALGPKGLGGPVEAGIRTSTPAATAPSVRPGTGSLKGSGSPVQALVPVVELATTTPKAAPLAPAAVPVSTEAPKSPGGQTGQLE